MIIGCLHLMGGPYSIIQLYAWANMVANYSQDSSLAEALSDTFSGERPCHLCEKITEAMAADDQEEQESPLAPTGSSKLFNELFAPTLAELKIPRSDDLPRTDFPAVAGAISAAPSGPLAPPPRAA